MKKRVNKRKKSEKESEQKKKLEKESEQKKESAKMQVTQNLKERERKTNFYARASEVKKALFLNKPMIVLLYKEALFNTNQLDTSLPSFIASLLQKEAVCKLALLDLVSSSHQKTYFHCLAGRTEQQPSEHYLSHIDLFAGLSTTF